MFGWIAQVYMPSFAEMLSGASRRSLSALLWLGKVFACSVGDRRLSEQIGRVVSFGVGTCVWATWTAFDLMVAM